MPLRSIPARRLYRGDQVLLRVFGHPVTVNEAHAVVLGLVGVPLGLLATVGPRIAGISMALLIGYAVLGPPTLTSLDHQAEGYGRGIGAKTIRHEPWWFAGSAIISMIVTIIVAQL